jgi:peptidoglycan/LPS O-acetylase OafA/YrhL
MGMMVAMDKFNISDRFIRYGVLFVLFAFIYRLLRYAGYVNSTDLYTFLILVFGLPSLCYWLSVLAQSFNKYRFSRPFLYCGSRSLELFVAHVFVFFCVKQFAVPGIVGFLLGVSLSLIIAEGLYQSKLKIIALF